LPQHNLHLPTVIYLNSVNDEITTNHHREYFYPLGGLCLAGIPDY